MLLQSKGRELIAEGRINEAIAFYKKQLSDRDEIGRSNASSELASLYENKSSKGLFAFFYRKKYHAYLREAIKYDFCSPLCDYAYARLNYERKDFTVAMHFIERAIDKYERILKANDNRNQPDFGLASMMYFKGLCFLGIANFVHALRTFLEVLNSINKRTNVNQHFNILHQLILKRIILIYMFRNDFASANRVLRKNILDRKSDENDESYRSFLYLSDLSSTLEEVTKNYKQVENIDAFVEKYFSEINKSASIESLVLLKHKILDGYNSGGFAEKFNQICEAILKQEWEFEKHVNTLQSELKNIISQKPNIKIEPHVQNDPELIEILNSAEKALLKAKKVGEGLITLSSSLTESGRNLTIKLLDVRYKEPIKFKLNFALLFIERYFFRIAIGVFFLGTLIPFILNDFIVGIIHSFVLSLILWFIDEKKVSPWIVNRVAPKYKESLTSLLLHMSYSLLIKYNHLLKKMSTRHVEK